MGQSLAWAGRVMLPPLGRITLGSSGNNAISALTTASEGDQCGCVTLDVLVCSETQIAKLRRNMHSSQIRTVALQLKRHELAAPYLRRLVTGFTAWWRWFDPRTGEVQYVAVPGRWTEKLIRKIWRSLTG